MNTSTSTILNGKEVSNLVCNKLAKEIEKIKSEGKRVPGLAVVLVGDDPASHAYVKNKEKKSEAIGLYSEVHKLPKESTEEEVIEKVISLNNSSKIDGIIVQLPLPKHIDTKNVINSLDPKKDADGLHPANLGKLLSGEECLTPCTPKGIMEILNHYSVKLEGKNAVVIGRSNLVGKPIALLLQQKNATITMTHSRTKDIEKVVAKADIVIAAIGKAHFVTSSWIKKGAVVVDVGINRIELDGKSKLVGDVDFDSVSSVCSSITPVPGGVGPMTVAMLMQNTIEAYKRSN